MSSGERAWLLPGVLVALHSADDAVGFVLVHQLVDDAFEAADVAAPRAVLFSDRLESLQPVGACGGRVDGGINGLKAAQATLDLTVSGELVRDLGGELRDLVSDLVQHQSASRHKITTVLEHRFNLGHGRVIDL
ncbi:hypothetical protein [Candidatus Poriferisodalis sp.]|uniref:hypothetical protein n=1 Tax=Candidatus Poriferisodalis sp. TaxID=3101277 RepID=UPI003B5262A0